MITDLIAKWLMPAMQRAVEGAKRKEDALLRPSRSRDDVFDGCDSINFRVIQLSNGTVIRMDNNRPMDDYVVQTKHRPPSPNVFIVKDDETVQDAIVRMLAIHQLEK
jgi:hypothetical protein